MRLSACLISLLGLTLFPAISPALSIVMPTIGELVLQPDRFYNQQVSVAGTIADYNEHISTQRKAYSISLALPSCASRQFASESAYSTWGN